MDARESGQATVEAALVTPVWLLLTFGAIQLALMQQGRLMTEYAAYSAARSGVVWSGNNERMRDAALLVLLPTIGPTGTMEELGRTWERARALDRRFHDALADDAPVPVVFKQSGLLGLVRVDVLSPARVPGDAPELPFDEEGTRTEEDAVASQLAVHGVELAERMAPLLTVRVRHLFELKVPFANQIIFAVWLAATLVPDTAGLPHLSASERALLGRLASGEGPFGNTRRFYIPLTATWTQRMQSPFHRKWLMHLAEVQR